MRDEVRWERMFPDELNAALEKCPVVYLTYGLCEPHGPQNALGQDGLRPLGAACLAARRFGGIVAPPHYWHCHELGGFGIWGHQVIGQARTWLTAIPPWMWFKMALYHVRTVHNLGFHAALMFSGHAGPHSPDLETFVQLVQPHVAPRIAFFTDFTVTPPDILPHFAHAGAVETEYLWAVAPDCVDLSRVPPPDAPGPHFAMHVSAAEANRREGEALVSAIADNLGKMAQSLLEEYERVQPPRRIMTFDDVERIWDEEFRPRLRDFNCMKGPSPESMEKAPPPESQWFANFAIPDRA
jgi:creatinine amidohydrolase